MQASLRSPRRIAWGVLAELQGKVDARASAITFGYGQNSTTDLVNLGYSPTVVSHLASKTIQADPDFRRALSTVYEPRFWVDVSGFSQTSIACQILRPNGYAEGTSIRLGDTGAVLHVSFSAEIMARHRALIAEYAERCVQVVDDMITAADIHLSPRETGVLSMIAEGATNGDIASELHITRRTVATHVEHILMKTNSKSRAHAAAKAIQLGLIDTK